MLINAGVFTVHIMRNSMKIGPYILTLGILKQIVWETQNDMRILVGNEVFELLIKKSMLFVLINNYRTAGQPGANEMTPHATVDIRSRDCGPLRYMVL